MTTMLAADLCLETSHAISSRTDFRSDIGKDASTNGDTVGDEFEHLGDCSGVDRSKTECSRRLISSFGSFGHCTSTILIQR